jgi:hypothetical protein
MKTQTKNEAVEAMIKQAMAGYRAIPEEVDTLVFPEQSLTRAQVIDHLQRGLDLFEDVRRTRAAYEAAVELHRRAMPRLKRFHAQSLDVAQRHFGSDPKRMATFGVTHAAKPKPRSRRRVCNGSVEEVVTTVVEEVTIVSEQASCESQAPSCEEQRKLPCRAKSKPRRVKPPCEEQKACGSRVSRGRK